MTARSVKTCGAAKCKKTAHARGLCPRHYQQWRARTNMKRMVRRPLDIQIPSEHAWCIRCHRVLEWAAFPRRIADRNIKSSTCRSCLAIPGNARLFRRNTRRVTVDEGFKWCRRCERVKPLDDFHADIRDGRVAHCKPCRLDASRERLYGLTRADFDRMVAEQGGRCMICRDPFAGEPHVDHEHATGVIRGLLCLFCNVGLGKFKDDPELLLTAAAYLIERRSASAVRRRVACQADRLGDMGADVPADVSRVSGHMDDPGWLSD